MHEDQDVVNCFRISIFALAKTIIEHVKWGLQVL